MKYLLLLSLMTSASAFAEIPVGTYLLEKINCGENGKEILSDAVNREKSKKYKICLHVKKAFTKMTARVTFKNFLSLGAGDCLQTNMGRLKTKDGKTTGYLNYRTSNCPGITGPGYEYALAKYKFGTVGTKDTPATFKTNFDGKTLTYEMEGADYQFNSCRKAKKKAFYTYNLINIEGMGTDQANALIDQECKLDLSVDW